MLHTNSEKSYKELKETGKRDIFRKLVYAEIMYSIGITDRQIMVELNETDPNNIRPEVTRLKQDGLIKEIGKTRCSYTGKTVRQVALTDEKYFDRKKAVDFLN